jgi:uncharacterized protein (DUF1800 family)
MPLPPFSSSPTLGPKRAAHLLHRASFGPTKEQIDNFANISVNQAVTLLFQGPLPEPVPLVDPETNQEWMISGTTDANSEEGDLQEFFKGWFIGQMLSAGVPSNQSLAYSVREKTVFFLHTLFTAIQTKIDSSRALYFQNQLFRQYAWDKTKGPDFTIKELTKKISVDNAMLRLLDGNQNVKGGIQENYARELLELYSIGRGLEGTVKPSTGPGDYFVFTETDVQEAAKVLTGWDFDDTFSNIDPDTLLPRGKVRGSVTNASAHDNSIKTFSSRLDGVVIQPDPLLLQANNPTEESLLDEIDQLVELIYSKQETARNICRRIYRFYVYYEIDQTLDDTIIQEMANTLIANDFKIQPVLEELFRSQHFYEAGGGNGDDNFGAIIRSPLDLVIGTYRFFGISMPDLATSPADYYEKTSEIIRSLSHMGMNFYEPFDVAGYDAYHQFPIYHRSWISTNYLTRRYEFITTLIPQDSTGGMMSAIDVVNFVRTKIPNMIASDARLLIIELAKYLLPLSDGLTFDTNNDDNSGLTAERLAYFLTTFLGTIDPDPEAAWTTRWTNSVGMEVVEGQLRRLFNAMMQSPEYQLY